MLVSRGARRFLAEITIAVSEIRGPRENPIKIP
jgi:hypothetical protein